MGKRRREGGGDGGEEEGRRSNKKMGVGGRQEGGDAPGRDDTYLWSWSLTQPKVRMSQKP